MPNDRCTLIPKHVFDIKVGDTILTGFALESQWSGLSKFTHPDGRFIIVHDPETWKPVEIQPIEALLIKATASILEAGNKINTQTT